MRILDVDFCWDGGSAIIKTSDGQYAVDRRLDTDTPNSIWDRHPDDEGAVRVDEVHDKLVVALKLYKPTRYDKAIAKLIEDLDQ